jgi:hypothetical protein
MKTYECLPYQGIQVEGKRVNFGDSPSLCQGKSGFDLHRSMEDNDGVRHQYTDGLQFYFVKDSLVQITVPSGGAKVQFENILLFDMPFKAATDELFALRADFIKDSRGNSLISRKFGVSLWTGGLIKYPPESFSLFSRDYFDSRKDLMQYFS